MTSRISSHRQAQWARESEKLAQYELKISKLKKEARDSWNRDEMALAQYEQDRIKKKEARAGAKEEIQRIQEYHQPRPPTSEQYTDDAV